MSANWFERLSAARMMPIVTVREVGEAVALVDDLVEAGVAAVEILFRSAGAPEALARCRERHPRLLIAAGTILSAELCARAADSGADFMVSPGLTPELAAAAKASPLPLLPGAQTASEVMAAEGLGFTALKFYPAEPNGAPAILRDYTNVFPAVRFVPTGGIGEAQLPAYAALRNVAAVGGSWLQAGLDANEGRRGELAARVTRAKAILGAL